MIINFRVCEISWVARKLARALVLIKKMKLIQSINPWKNFIYFFACDRGFVPRSRDCCKVPRSFFPSLLNSDPFWTLNSASIWSWTYWVWSPNCFWMPSIETCSEFCRCWSCSSIRWMINRGIKALKWFWYQIC